jgi:mRNA-degrading endonuclease RelE of RelBE toxin-antitoxin system
VKFTVRVAGPAARYLSRLSEPAHGRALAASTKSLRIPTGGITKPLHGAGGRRGARVGGLRIVFTVDRDQRVVDVVEIGPRGEIYRRL